MWGLPMRGLRSYTAICEVPERKMRRADLCEYQEFAVTGTGSGKKRLIESCIAFSDRVGVDIHPDAILFLAMKAMRQFAEVGLPTYPKVGSPTSKILLPSACRLSLITYIIDSWSKLPKIKLKLC